MLRILFAIAVLLCLGEVAWWTYFQLRETTNLERAALALERGSIPEAARALGAERIEDLAERARRHRWMFISEGAVLGLLVLLGVVMVYAAAVQERRLRLAQERFLTGATHALKTPLATVRLGLESLQADTIPEHKRPAYLAAMVRELDRLERDLENLLAAAEAGERTMTATAEPGDLAADVESVAAELASRYTAAGVELCLDLRARPVVKREPRALHTALRNLLDNAAKYSERGDRVDVVVEENGKTARVLVRDRGRGMSVEELHHAFDRFYRGRSRSEVGGAGLGLYLVRQIARTHGGEVSAHSEGPGRGAMFELRLPLHER